MCSVPGGQNRASDHLQLELHTVGVAMSVGAGSQSTPGPAGRGSGAPNHRALSPDPTHMELLKAHVKLTLDIVCSTRLQHRLS